MTQASLVRIERHEGIAVIEVDNPPVNALSDAMRVALLGAVREVLADGSVKGAVLAAAGKTFIAGADIREFDKPPGEVTTGIICGVLDEATKPFVAALHGTALGGGFELALACHARVLAPEGRVGLPESRVGLIPSGGGVQRLVRLAGALKALDLVASGRHVEAGEAMKLGIVDEVATDPRAAAIARAKQLAEAGHWRVASKETVPEVDRAALDAAVTQVKRRARGAVAPGASAEAVTWALDMPFAEAAAKERARSVELRAGPQCKALRHLFHAERVAARGPAGAAAWPVTHVGVIGGGTMGSGIAIALLEAGLKVTILETTINAAAGAEARIRAVHARQYGAGRLSQRDIEGRMRRLAYTYRYEKMAEVDLVIEAVFEDIDVKREVFRNLSPHVRRDCILASNTSALDIELLADEVDAPERVLGLHFFSPAHVMRLLEVVQGRRTLPEVLATAMALAQRMRKQAVISGVCDGFIGNRILGRWWAQCDYMLEEGAFPEQIDAALEAAGFAMGPYAVADLAGLDIAAAGRKRKAATRDARARDVAVIDELVARGRYGQKTGAGWYRHDGGKRAVDPLVHELIVAASAAKGITRREITAEEIVGRVRAAMVNEAAKVLAEGIALRPSDIDVVLVHGYGFPAWRGGPMHEADALGLAGILETVRRMGNDGPDFAPAALLEELVASGRTFGSLNG